MITLYTRGYRLFDRDFYAESNTACFLIRLHKTGDYMAKQSQSDLVCRVNIDTVVKSS